MQSGKRQEIPAPIEVIPLDEHTTRILWSDGQNYVYFNRDLRAACSCASCRGKRTTEHSLDRETIPADIHITDSHPVGNYGIKFIWSDGHSTGIYNFDTFKHLDPVI